MIRWETDAAGRVGVATIDRPERRNALNADLCDELRTCLQGARGVRAVVLTGAGGTFCAGADLARRAEDLAGGLEHGGDDTFRPAFERVLDAIVAFPSPVIAAVEGPALGAGMQLAVACDLRVASPGATFGIPAARLGVHLSPANIARLLRLAGPGVARAVLLAAEVYDAAGASAAGLVHRIADDALADAREWAAEIATLAPLTVAGHKQSLVLLEGDVPPRVREEIRALEAACFASDDLQEGLAAFAEKRRAEFRGR